MKSQTEGNITNKTNMLDRGIDVGFRLSKKFPYLSIFVKRFLVVKYELDTVIINGGIDYDKGGFVNKGNIANRWQCKSHQFVCSKCGLVVFKEGK